MIELYKVLKKPLITEKTTDQKDAQNKVSFVVHPDANKLQVKEAIEKIFGVHVMDVNTVNMLGKVKGFRQKRGKRSDWKKAIVTLRSGDKIEFFE